MACTTKYDMDDNAVDIDGTYSFKNIIFPFDIRRSRDIYEDDECRKGWTFTFTQCFLWCRPSWSETFTRYRQSFNHPYHHTLVKCTITDDDGVIYEAYGCHIEQKRASDIACYRLGEILLENCPLAIMPPYLIGFPNIRGHCFLIAAVLPVFYSFPIMQRLFRINCQSVLEVNLGLGLKRPSKRPRIETPRMWIQSLLKCYHDFHKVSSKGYYDMVNLGYLQKRIFPESRSNPELPDRPVNPRYDIMLDVALIKGICNMLGNYCDTDYLKPGGDECQAYGFIMTKLCATNPELYGEIMFRFKANFVCGNCCGGPYTHEFALPYISVPVNKNFQSLFNEPIALATAQRLSRTHGEPYHCPGRLRDIDFCEFLEHPEVLCVRYEFGKSDEEINVPDKLTLVVKGETKKYKRLCSSVVIKCYENIEGEPYPPFFRKPSCTDKFTTWHTYLQINTIHGWYEVNNGEIYPVDTRLFKKATPGSMHFYQLKEYDCFLPDLVLRFVDFYPER
ncbi:uncharacterized protein LOC107371371 [Tetranychus urticae]|uniref:uncharacterized protein LOC107371371 n=1 Tax=Tetranychus urticae TaxID=32264 RepID=UPI000D64EADC|nr:uncharacterized protein LOC107371371 [Tetranychus urticae]XP_025018521.1 uncharacterized protein LOC107371371 [Tetranychus urticae]XP_025018522.1 uncharacterized protein LOC107371371 [Tetranychus urticae]